MDRACLCIFRRSCLCYRVNAFEAQLTLIPISLAISTRGR